MATASRRTYNNVEVRWYTDWYGHEHEYFATLKEARARKAELKDAYPGVIVELIKW